MQTNKKDGKLPEAETGNASNPSPDNEELQPANGQQLFDKKAEKYLRESGNIEDVPDAQERQELDENNKN